jgi:hypothetical protein
LQNFVFDTGLRAADVVRTKLDAGDASLADADQLMTITTRRFFG